MCSVSWDAVLFENTIVVTLSGFPRQTSKRLSNEHVGHSGN